MTCYKRAKFHRKSFNTFWYLYWGGGLFAFPPQAQKLKKSPGRIGLNYIVHHFCAYVIAHVIKMRDSAQIQSLISFLSRLSGLKWSFSPKRAFWPNLPFSGPFCSPIIENLCAWEFTCLHVVRNISGNDRLTWVSHMSHIAFQLTHGGQQPDYFSKDCSLTSSLSQT